MIVPPFPRGMPAPRPRMPRPPPSSSSSSETTPGKRDDTEASSDEHRRLVAGRQKAATGADRTGVRQTRDTLHSTYILQRFVAVLDSNVCS